MRAYIQRADEMDLIAHFLIIVGTAMASVSCL